MRRGPYKSYLAPDGDGVMPKSTFYNKLKKYRRNAANDNNVVPENNADNLNDNNAMDGISASLSNQHGSCEITPWIDEEYDEETVNREIWFDESVIPRTLPNDQRQKQQRLLQKQQQHLLEAAGKEVQQAQTLAENHYINHDKFLFGDDIYIPSAAFRQASLADVPSKFVITMAHAVWQKEVLAKKVVRKQRNTGVREALTPRKIELLSYHLENFLTNRNYSAERICVELKKINTYLGRAITSAKKKLNF